MSEDFSRSVAAVVIREGKALLARHTYGNGRGKLIVPGGYLNEGEEVFDALKREVFEETGIFVEPKKLVGVRFNQKDWYAVFSAEYTGGEARSDCDENDEVVWLPIEEALERDDVPTLTKELIKCVLNEKNAFDEIPYKGNANGGKYRFFGAKKDFR